MEINQYTWSRQTVRKRWVSFEPFTPMEFLCQSASDPTSHIENQDVQSQLDVEDALSNVFESNAAGISRSFEGRTLRSDKCRRSKRGSTKCDDCEEGKKARHKSNTTSFQVNNPYL